MHIFLLLFQYRTKFLFAIDMAHVEGLERSEPIDLIWAFDFHLSEGGTWRVVIRRQFIV